MVNRALVVIDVQNEYDTGALRIVHPPLDDALANIARAMDAARAAHIPVVVVQQHLPAAAPVFAAGSPSWELHPVVASRPHDHLVRKALPGAFTGTGLEQWLRDRGADTVTLVGFMTQMCVDTTARQAAHAGLTAEVLGDATGTVNYSNDAGSVSAEDLHVTTLTVLHSRIAAVASTEEWVGALEDGRPLPVGSLLASARGA